MHSKLFVPISIFALISVVFISGCLQQEQPIGGETDEHGCMLMAGYTWCEARQKCLRTWVEECENYDGGGCNSKCIEEGYDVGHCMWETEICDDDVEKAGCLIPRSIHCGNPGQCNCYCKNETPIGGETGEHGCMLMAGYTWCESKQRCLRTWEEDCPNATLTPDECEAKGGRVLNIVGGFDCADNETNIGEVEGFISPHVCCLYSEEYCIKADSGNAMSLSEAKQIALASDCIENATLKDTYVCNGDTGTWWIDLDIEMEGCNPACVVKIETKTAVINWRCTGLLPQ